MNKLKTTNQKRLMLVDDDPNLVLLVKDYLEFSGYEVLTASNGEEALEMLEQEIPDLIVCDVMMPGMNGYSLVEQLRKNSRMDKTPVVFLSAKGQTQDRVKGLNTGADVYLVKPFEPEEFVAQVASSLRQASRLQGSEENSKDNIKIQPTIEIPHDVKLTRKELEVLQLVARGKGNQEIAQEMKVNRRTVESHISNMLKKTGLHNRTELARWAMESHQVF